ncbi:MAG: MBL fold metallo-hydrolase [Clostridia bacterium]|nr:MBL fold metallo-hydrolase [Clostridia bacterium]
MTAKKRRRSSRSPIVILFTLILVIIAGVYAACDGLIDIPGVTPDETESNQNGIADSVPVPDDGEVIFHFIDVGQGDAILITTPDGNMLVDTSVKSARDQLVAYLDSVGVTELEYLVLTHPDADHIGNADYIIENYDIKNILLPDQAATSKTYERMLTAMENSSANVICPEPGYVFSLGALQNTVIAPNKDYNDANEMSIVFKAVYGETSVMMTGDAEIKSEEDIVKLWSAADLKCDILKVGHHGSTTSTTQEFLDAVDPDIAVISCGEGNTYGHPHDETLDKLAAKGVTVYRTDTQGTIIFKTDGETFTLVQ